MTQPKRDIINATQAAMLDILRDSPHAICVSDLFARLGISRPTSLKQMTGLREAELVTETTPVCKKTKAPALWTISGAGRRALADYARKLDLDASRAMRVAPPSRSIWGTHYTPPSNVYYRNNGNRHIASAGVLC